MKAKIHLLESLKGRFNPTCGKANTGKIIVLSMVSVLGAIPVAHASDIDGRCPHPFISTDYSKVLHTHHGDMVCSMRDMPGGSVCTVHEIVETLAGHDSALDHAAEHVVEHDRSGSSDRKDGGPRIEESNQLLFDETGFRLPALIDFSTDAEFGDVDGDGDIDLLIANTDMEQNRLYINDGHGIYFDETSARLPVDDDFTLSADFGDVDGDGDLDIFMSNNFAFQLPDCFLISGQNRLLINNGQGIYRDETVLRLPESVAASTDAKFLDADGDGDMDIVVTNSIRPGECLFLGGGQLQLLINDGRGFFADGTSERLPLEYHSDVSVATGDIDGDGDIDLAIANPFDRDRLLVNDGFGYFYDQSNTKLPNQFGSTRDIVLVDADGDSDLDMFCANDSSSIWFSEVAAQNRMLINNGTGVFTDETATRLPASLDVSMGGADAGDVDGDGDVDVIVANNWLMSRGRQNHLLLNEGADFSNSGLASSLPSIQDISTDVELGDINGDGLLDAIVANYGEQNLLLIGKREPKNEPTEPEFMMGDVNLDAEVNILDVLSVVNHILGQALLIEEGQDLADCNGDEQVNILDALGIVNTILGMGDCNAGSNKTLVAPEVLDFLHGLEPHLSGDDFALLVSMIESTVPIPGGFNVSQNYPNPFNPQTSIAYDVPEVSRVMIAVYNSLGHMVDVLVDDEQDAGHHEVSWNAKGLSSGIYFCRIRAHGLYQKEKGVFTATRRMVLMK